MNTILSNLMARMAVYGATSDPDSDPGELQRHTAPQKSPGPALAPVPEAAQQAGSHDHQDSRPCDAQGFDEDDAFGDPLDGEFDWWPPEEEGPTAESTLPVETGAWVQTSLDNNDGELETEEVAHVAHWAHFFLRTKAEKTKNQEEVNVLNVEKGGSGTCAPCAPCATDEDGTLGMSRAGTENTALDVGDIPEIPEGERAITPPYSAGVEPTQPRARTSERTAHAGPALVADGAAMRAETVCSTEPVTGDEGPFSVLTPSLGVESLTDRQLVNLPVGTRVRVFRQLTEEAKQLCLACSHPLAIPLAYQALSQGYVLVSHAGQLFRLPA